MNNNFGRLSSTFLPRVTPMVVLLVLLGTSIAVAFTGSPYPPGSTPVFHGELAPDTLRSPNYSHPSSDPFGLAVGDEVKVVASTLNCRASPSPNGTLISTESNGQLGQITNGSVSIGGYIWWEIAYTDGHTGWSAEGTGTTAWLQNVTGTSTSTVAYNRTAAMYYAAHYWNVVTSDGYFWNGSSTYVSLAQGTSVVNMSGDDCAHFVSQVIGDEPHQPGGGLNIPSRVPPTYGEPGNAALGDMLINNGWAVVVPSVNDLLPGDVINYQWLSTDSTWDHIAVYLGNGTVAAHTNSHFGANWTLGGAYAYRFIHILNGTVSNPLQISAFAATPSSIPVSSTTYLNVTATGGTSPLYFAYSGLPSGCSSANTAALTCVPTAAGRFNVTVTVTDAGGASATRNTSLVVISSPTALQSLALTASTPSIMVGTSANLTAVAQCAPGPCPAGIRYQWSVTPTALGTLSPTGPGTASFTAGSNPGTVSLAVNATLNGTTKTAGPVMLAITAPTVTLSSVSVSPSNPALIVGGSLGLIATPVCQGGTCLPSLSLAWALSDPALGTLNTSKGASATFKAGGSAGIDTVTVTATLGGTVRMANDSVTIQANSSLVALESVSVTPANVSLSSGQAQRFTAVPVCGGGTCPLGIVFAWSTNDTLGSLSTDVGSTTVLTTGSGAGVVLLEVQAHWNGKTVSSATTITIAGSTAGTPSSGGSAFSSSDWWILGTAGLLALIGGIAGTLRRRRKTAWEGSLQ